MSFFRKLQCNVNGNPYPYTRQTTIFLPILSMTFLKPFHNTTICKPCNKTNVSRGEGASVFAPFFLKGSLSVEAALVFSLMFFLLLICISMFDFLQFQLRLSYEIDRELRYAAIENYSEAVTGYQMRKAWKSCLKKTSPLLRVSDAPVIEVTREEANICGLSHEILCVHVSGRAAPAIGVFGPLGWQLELWDSRRLWNGQSSVTRGNRSDAEETYVYVTRYGEVYHTNRNCRTINVTVLQTSASKITKLRTNDGKKYKPCSYCGKRSNGEAVLYYTAQGADYHRRRNCLALVRWVTKVPLSQVGDKRRCSYCSGG